MPTITRKASTTIRDEWSTKVPNVAPHLNLNAGVSTPNLATYVEGGVGETNEYGGFDFSAIPANSVINSIAIVQHSLNIATQEPRATRFAIRIAGVERAAVQFDVTCDEPTTQHALLTPTVTPAELATMSIEKLCVVGDPLNDPPVPEGLP